MTATISSGVPRSDSFKVGYSISMFEAIIGHLGAADMQRSPSDDKIISDHIVAALAAAKIALQTLESA